MNYYGVIVSEQIDEKTLYGFLRDALMQECGDLIPIRGPQCIAPMSGATRTRPTERSADLRAVRRSTKQDNWSTARITTEALSSRRSGAASHELSGYRGIALLMGNVHKPNRAAKLKADEKRAHPHRSARSALQRAMAPPPWRRGMARLAGQAGSRSFLGRTSQAAPCHAQS